MNSFLNYTDTSPSIYLIVASGIKYCFNTINELKKKKSTVDAASVNHIYLLCFRGF